MLFPFFDFLLLFEAEHLFQPVPERHPVGRQTRMLPTRLLRVVEHPRTEAHAAMVALEDVVVAAPFAPLPEGLVVGQLRKGHGHVAQPRIELHDRKRCRDTEYLSIRESSSG